MTITIGLFGTCGRSRWREPFIAAFEEKEIAYFNPQVPDWKPENAAVEAEHLANDDIILFPVTSETYAFGSLAETGFSVLQAVATGPTQRSVVVMIAPTLDDALMADAAQAKASLSARALVTAHLKKLDLPNVHVVEDLEMMLAVSLDLYDAHRRLAVIRAHCA